MLALILMEQLTKLGSYPLKSAPAMARSGTASSVDIVVLQF